MKPTAIKPWELRIEDMDTSNGVSNKMIRACMEAEIKELRRAVRDQEKTKTRELRALERHMITQVNLVKRRLNDAKNRATLWREHATRYQNIIAKRKP